MEAKSHLCRNELVEQMSPCLRRDLQFYLAFAVAWASLVNLIVYSRHKDSEPAQKRTRRDHEANCSRRSGCIRNISKILGSGYRYAKDQPYDAIVIAEKVDWRT
jgi:hypothetical protein